MVRRVLFLSLFLALPDWSAAQTLSITPSQRAEIDRLAADVHPKVVETRRDLHQHPELGVFFFLGVRNEAKKITAMIHTEYFDLDEDALQLGVRAMTTTAMDYLQRD